MRKRYKLAEKYHARRRIHRLLFCAGIACACLTSGCVLLPESVSARCLHLSDPTRGSAFQAAGYDEDIHDECGLVAKYEYHKTWIQLGAGRALGSSTLVGSGWTGTLEVGTKLWEKSNVE